MKRRTFFAALVGMPVVALAGTQEAIDGGNEGETVLYADRIIPATGQTVHIGNYEVASAEDPNSYEFMSTVE